MGYRLTIESPDGEIIAATKLYGYLEDEALRQCKSLKWLISHHKLDDVRDYGIDENDPEYWYYKCWDCDYRGEQLLTREEFAVFISLYIIDSNRFFNPDKDPKYWLRIEHFEEAFDYDHVKIGWW